MGVARSSASFLYPIANARECGRFSSGAVCFDTRSGLTQRRGIFRREWAGRKPNTKWASISIVTEPRSRLELELDIGPIAACGLHSRASLTVRLNSLRRVARAIASGSQPERGSTLGPAWHRRCIAQLELGRPAHDPTAASASTVVASGCDAASSSVAARANCARPERQYPRTD